ncbi:MAG: TRAP transporter substrate-binding protein DctP [Syntrophales bacterium]|nr:TRAP transporter substrate-binding protein DctP [Syntrophales bacterium]
MFKKSLFAIFVLIAFAFSSFAVVEAKTVVKYGHVGPPIHTQHFGALAFAKYVTEKTKGEIEVQVFPLGQLGGERSMTEQVQAGTLHMTAETSLVLSNYVPEFGIIELPLSIRTEKRHIKSSMTRKSRKGLPDTVIPKGLFSLDTPRMNSGTLQTQKDLLSNPTI